jgi:hypothetical protein
MARISRVTHVDDLDGSEASETIIFSLGRRSYVIGSVKGERCEAPEQACSVRRRCPPPRCCWAPAADASWCRPGAVWTRPRKGEGHRRWARQHGHKVADRGQIPSSVLQAYRNEVG